MYCLFIYLFILLLIQQVIYPDYNSTIVSSSWLPFWDDMKRFLCMGIIPLYTRETMVFLTLVYFIIIIPFYYCIPLLSV